MRHGDISSINRRDFLKRSLAAGSVMAVSGCTWPSGWNEKSNSKPIEFGVITDTHINPKNPGFTTRLQWVCDQLNQHDLDFVLHLGDIIENPCSDEEADMLFDVIERLRHKVYYVPGNHDCGVSSEQQGWPEAVKWFNKRFGPDYFTIRRDNVGIVALHTFLVGQRAKGFGIGDWPSKRFEEQLAQADRDLKQMRQEGIKHRLVRAHVPAYGTKPDQKMDYHSLAQPWRQQFLDLLIRRKVAVFQTGHMHFEWKNVYKANGFETILRTQTAIAWPSREAEKKLLGYRIYRATKDELTQQFFPIPPRLNKWMTETS